MSSVLYPLTHAAEARRRSSIRWKLHQRAIASIEIKKAEEQSSKPAAPKLRGESTNSSQAFMLL